MTVKEFAAKQRLKTRVDEDLTDIILGKRGHIYEYDDDLLGVIVMPEDWQVQYWTYAKKALTRLQCAIVQDGDYEGAATFNPQNREQVRAALRAAGIHRIRRSPPPSPAQAAARATFTRMNWASTRKRPEQLSWDVPASG